MPRGAWGLYWQDLHSEHYEPEVIWSKQLVTTLQAAAPTAISVLLIAESEQLNAAGPAQLILNSTLVALISVPLWGLLLGPLNGTP